jgi:hypothetical protein
MTVRTKVRIGRRQYGPEAKCQDKCPFWSIYIRNPSGVDAMSSAFSPAEVRAAARKHVAETGHTVEVIAEDVTRYEPGEGGGDG